ncbi:MAG: FAD-binding protein [Gemmatimonadota bacterium]
MNERWDVLVLGGGAAGCAAALAAAEAGARTALLRAGPGASALGSGGWRGPLAGTLRDRLAAAGYPLEEAGGPLPHPHGDLRHYELAGASHAGASPVAGTLVVGIAGIAGFHAPALARLWGEAGGVPLRAAEVTLGGTPAAGWSPVALAALLDREPERLGHALRTLDASDDAFIILPAVLGLERPEATRATVAEAAGRPVHEALGTPPSLPGWRLDRALLAALASAGVTVIEGRAERCQLEDGRARRALLVRRNGGADTDALEAHTFVLATGKFLGGGVVGGAVGGEHLRDAVFGLPATAERFGERIPEAEPLAVTDVDRTDAQPLLAAGVRLDADGRPLGTEGVAGAANVWAAGSVRAGAETAWLGLGHAAAEGWRAGTRAAAAAARGGAS